MTTTFASLLVLLLVILIEVLVENLIPVGLAAITQRHW